MRPGPNTLGARQAPISEQHRASLRRLRAVHGSMCKLALRLRSSEQTLELAESGHLFMEGTRFRLERVIEQEMGIVDAAARAKRLGGSP